MKLKYSPQGGNAANYVTHAHMLFETNNLNSIFNIDCHSFDWYMKFSDQIVDAPAEQYMWLALIAAAETGELK